MAETTIRSDLIRGSIDAMLLRVLSAHDSYGYEIIKTIAQRTGGRYELKEPSLYTSLKRLERDGCVQSYWGDASQGARRKYYRITPAGAALLLVRGQISCLAAFVLAAVLGVWYLCSLRGESCVTMTVDAAQLRRQSRTVWFVWGVCFAVCVATVSAAMFSSNVWFSRPVRIDGPCALGVMAAPYYLALSTVVFPIAVGRFPRLIAQCERGGPDEA